GIGERGDPGLGRLVHRVWLGDYGRAGRLETLEVTQDVRALDVPDQAAGVGVPTLDLVVRADGDPGVADHPARIAAVFPAGLAEEPGVVVGQPLWVLGPDQDAIEVHVASLVACSLPFGR